MLIPQWRRRDYSHVPNWIGLFKGQHVLKVERVSADHLKEAPEDLDGALYVEVAGSEQLAVEVIIVCK